MKIQAQGSLHPIIRNFLKSFSGLRLSARVRAAFLAGAFALLAGGSLRAQTYTWDPNKNTTGSDGAGTWDASTAIWASGGADVVWPNTASLATIGSGLGAAGTITLSPATVITNNGITFRSPLSGNYILSGGTNYLAGATPTITVTGSNALILSTLQGTSGLTTAGTGTLALGGSNTYSGATTVSQGTLQLTNLTGNPPVLPVLYMSFNQVNGVTVTNQGTGGAAMNGTLTGTAAIASGSGMFGHNALSIPSGSATAAYVLVANSVVPLNGNSTGNWTVAMWIKTTVAGTVYMYQGSGGWASGNTEFYLENGTQGDGAGTHQGGVRNSQSWVSGTGAVNDGNWHFIVMTMNAGTKTLYSDGAVDAILSGSGSWTGTGPGSEVSIGGTPSTGADSQVALGGLLSDVYIFNTSLNQGQVAALMTSTNGSISAPVNLPPATTVAVASGATLDLAGQTVAVAGLSGAGTVDSTYIGGALVLNNASANTFSGTIKNSVGPLGLTLNGPAALTLSGANTYQGPTVVNVGTLNLPGSLESSNATAATFAIGGSTGNTNAVVNFSGTFWTNYNLQLGVLSGQNAALYQTAGTLALTQGANSSDFQIGNAVGAYGYYSLGAGASLFCNEIGVAGEGVSLAGYAAGAGNGMMEVKGGTVTDTGWLVMTRLGSGTQTGILNVYSGSTLNYGTINGGGLVINWGTAGTAVINVLGGSLSTTNNVPINLNDNNNAGNTGILNLNGGIAQVGFINGGANNTYVNFNGGTLQANENQGSMMTGLKAAYIFGPGGTINNNGFNITIGQAFLSPTNGIYGITSFTGGAGYIAPPIVTVVRGTGDTTGVDATAIAQIDTSTGATGGQVTNIIITCPGVNYTATPTFTLTDGGATTVATITGATPTANAIGNLTITGSGVTTLTGPLTFSGKAIIAQGTLEIVGSGQADATPIAVNDGAKLIEVPLAAGLWSPVSLTIGSTTGGTLAVTASGSAQPYMTISNLTLVGTASITIYGNLVAGNTYTLLAYTNLTGTLASGNFALPNGVVGNVTSATASGETIWSLTVTSVTPTIWSSAVNGTWDINTTANWIAPNAGTKYLDGSPVQFDDIATDNTGGIYVITNLGTVVSPSTVYFTNNANNYTLSNTAVIAGGGGITKDGAASVTVYGVNTYTGPTVVKAGSLVAGSAPPGPLASVSGPFGYNSAMILSNNATAGLNVNNLSIRVGSLSGGGPVGGNVSLGSGTLTFGGDNSSQTFVGVISGTGGITQNGLGTNTLTGANIFTGTATATTGTLAVGGNGVLGGANASIGGAGALTIGGAGTIGTTEVIANAGIFNYNSSASMTNSAVNTGAGVWNINGPGTLALGGASSFSGNIVVNGGILSDIIAEAVNNPTVGGLGNPRTTGRTITINNGGIVSLDCPGGNGFGFGSVIPVFTFIVNQGGLLRVTSGNDTFNNITLNGGTLSAQSQTGTQYDTFEIGGNITVGGTSPSLMTSLSAGPGGGFNLGMNSATATETFTVAVTGSSAPDLLVAAPLAGAGGQTVETANLVKTGPGTMALAGTNGYIGNTTISAGILMLTNGGDLNSENYPGNIINNSIFIDASLAPMTGQQVVTGAISGTGTNIISGAGVQLNLQGTNTATGPTIINGGTLFLSGSASLSNTISLTITNGGVFDVSQLASPIYYMATGATLLASNAPAVPAINGSLVTSQGSQIIPAGTNLAGTLTISKALTVSLGTGVSFDLSTSHSAGNDQIVVNGALTLANGNSITLNALGGAAALDQTSDYVLITGATSMSGGFNAGPIWTGTLPANFNHFIVTNDATHGQVRLTYSTVAVPSISTATTTPASGILRNQTVQLNVTVIPGGASITGVSINLSSLGGAVSTPLALSATANVWTNSVVIPPGTPAGNVLLPVTATDANSNQGAGNVVVAVVTSAETWSGGATAGLENFSNNTNWAIESGGSAPYAPGYIGDAFVFAGLGGTAGLNPVMDSSYTVRSVTFNSSATNYNITAANSSVLTVNGGITNNSTNVETLAVPIVLGASENFTAISNTLVLSGSISDSRYPDILSTRTV